MTIDKVEILSDKISFLEKKIDRIEELLLLLVEEEYLTEEEKLRIAQADELIKNRKFDKLVKVN
ncbi:MAG: hypothetical protein HeimAB125_11160 [Candidatus Heimdallarchaeota archaeon AB_125]|nr:MAG: hypothetical protein HeimAB125_11160 [Candidatus Heimdallarchaeota archaeon AB_125]